MDDTEPNEDDAYAAFIEALGLLAGERTGLALVSIGYYTVTVIKSKTFTPRDKGPKVKW